MFAPVLSDCWPQIPDSCFFWGFFFNENFRGEAGVNGIFQGLTSHFFLSAYVYIYKLAAGVHS